MDSDDNTYEFNYQLYYKIKYNDPDNGEKGQIRRIYIYCKKLKLMQLLMIKAQQRDLQ